jgi:dTDP-4-dehydrorhamnose reductase
MAHILLLGRDGQLGQALLAVLQDREGFMALGRAEVDFRDPDAVRLAVRDLKPDVVVNAAAYTAVDKAESEPDLAMRVNALSVGALGEAAAVVGARVIHYSTDYVFDGRKQTAYVETDATGPLQVYGESKLAGENALLDSDAHCLVLRTSWVFDAQGRNFVNTMLRLGREREELRVVDDQVGAPTSAEDLAAATVAILAKWTVERGVYHATAQGEVSWAGFAREIFAQAGIASHVVPIPAVEYPTPAARPQNSRLDGGKLRSEFGIVLPQWQDGLRRVLAVMSKP